ncbi:hypothetical protein ACSBR1_019219 [Camellia fascicularis]
MTLFQEEILWYQKSQNKWLTMGDSNTKFFHISTLNKRRKLKIQVLKDGNAHIVDHFTKLFQHEETQLLTNWVNIAWTGFTRE